MPEIINLQQKNKEESNQPELINFEWQALEFEKYEKGPSWFIAVGIIALAIFAISLFMENFLFAFLIILFVFAIFIYALKEPKLIKFKIDGRGLMIDEKLYPYDEIKSFWIFYDPPQLKELSVKSKKYFTPIIKVPLAEQDPIKIRQALTRFVPEEKQEESLADALAKYLKF